MAASKFNPEFEYLVVNQDAADQFREILSYTPVSGTMADIRKVVVSAAAEGNSVDAWFRQGLSGRECHEKIVAVIQGFKVIIKLIHTQKRAPDGQKRVCFFASLRQYSRAASRSPSSSGKKRKTPAHIILEKAAMQANTREAEGKA